MDNPGTKSKTRWRTNLLVVPLLPVLLLVAAITLVLSLVATVCLHITIWTWWCLRGRDILFVYSDSPVWHDYIEEAILPHLGERAVILNWSQRKRWRFSLARLAFHHFAGYRQFNPLAVVFRPFHRSRIFRFWQPFRDFKHGKPQALHQMEREFLGVIGVPGHEPSA